MKFAPRPFILILCILTAPFVLSSCATRKPVPSPGPSAPITKITPADTSVRSDTTHIVSPGETLWRIAKMYDVPIATIMQVNRILDPGQIRMGQKLIIPQAARLRPVIALFPSEKWQYIIIHHSATDEGSSLAFHKYHIHRGWDSVGYDFVIDNGSDSKQDGEIEVTPRWIKQLDGAHCKADDMNTKGIGICLVGNFDTERVSDKQMESLVYLVNTLRKYYRIPANHIMGHGQVPGATTHCPGHNFPWSAFRARLNDS